MYIADTLSRAYLTAPNQVSEEEQEFIRAVENVKMTKHLPISPERLQEMQEKTRDDVTLQDLKKNIENGWPDERSKVLPRTRAYYKFRGELSVQGGVLFKGERVIVPMAMKAPLCLLESTCVEVFLINWQIIAEFLYLYKLKN